MTTNSQTQFNTSTRSLHMSLELSASTWKLGFADQLGRPPRVRTIDAGNFEKLMAEIKLAKRVFGLDDDAPVASCYEAGRDGFWIHRCLVAVGIESHIVDPASIEVNRKKRRAKTDRIDAQKIVLALLRFKAGDRFACRMIRVPDAEAEDARQLNREMRTVKTERSSHTNRIKGLLVTQGITQVAIDRKFLQRLDQMKTAQGEPLGENLKQRLRREFERLTLATEQIRAMQMQQAAMIRQAAKEIERTEESEKRASRQAVIAERLCQLGGIGPVTSWTLSTEIFSWRDIANRRQLAALVGLVPTPHASGDEEKEQGISKSGRGELRVLMIEIAWGWLMFQPESDLSKWYCKRFSDGTSRNRKIGIVALARKLLVALGKYVKSGEIPGGARLKEEHQFRYLMSLQPKKGKADSSYATAV
jgi:transposase